jgi:hypothetical protein
MQQHALRVRRDAFEPQQRVPQERERRHQVAREARVPARAQDSRVHARVQRTRARMHYRADAHIGWMMPPIRPMSWYGGSQITPLRVRVRACVRACVRALPVAARASACCARYAPLACSAQCSRTPRGSAASCR